MPAFALAQNIGIGTSTPDHKLTVLGDGAFRNSAMTFVSNKVNGGVLLVANNNGNGQTIRIDGGNIQSTYSDPLIFPPANFTRPLVLNPFGGNVGIGTNFVPEYKLHLWSSGEQLIKIDGSNSLILFHDNGSNVQYGFLRAWTNNPFNPVGYYGLEIGTPPSVGADPAKRLMFSTNYALRMAIMEDGKIGVRTTSPNSTFEINGSLSMPIRTVVAEGSYDITDEDYTIIADLENNPNKTINLVLPSAVNRKGRIYNISAVNASSVLLGATTGLVNIFNNGPALFDKLAYEYLAKFSPFEFTQQVKTNCTIQSDGIQWYLISTNLYRYSDTH